MPLKKYIEENFHSLAEFARLCDVKPQQVTKWINMECIIVNGKLYSPRRDVPIEH